MKLILLHTTSIFLLLASISYSKEINISSDELVIDRKNNISIFSGNVYAFEKNLEIWADQLTLKFNYEKNEVEEIYAEQNVKIARENIIATGNTGFYYPANNKIKMLNDVEVMENENFVRCDELILDITNSISIMRSKTKSRVEAIIVNKN
jgi:lipopolysaccharide transport protein LptA